MTYYREAVLQFDGACQTNPGEGGAGYVLIDDYGDTILEGRYYIGSDCTNNVAEYFALIQGLKQLRDSQHQIGRLIIQGDSELVINHLLGVYRVKSSRLRPLYHRTKELVSRCQSNGVFVSYEFQHIYREDNERADDLANDAEIILVS